MKLSEIKADGTHYALHWGRTHIGTPDRAVRVNEKRYRKLQLTKYQVDIDKKFTEDPKGQYLRFHRIDRHGNLASDGDGKPPSAKTDFMARPGSVWGTYEAWAAHKEERAEIEREAQKRKNERDVENQKAWTQLDRACKALGVNVRLSWSGEIPDDASVSIDAEEAGALAKAIFGVIRQRDELLEKR